MKFHLLLGLIVAVAIVSAGCSKSDKAPPAPEFQGVQVDLPKLTAAFENANQDLKTTTTQVGFNVRYQKYEDALMGLDKLANDPNVTEAQKKVVNEVIEQVKKLAGATPAAAPAQ
ncbi:MAG TPA: hypothetical protein VFE51_25310 [Verrucomicrobiae bacterium]|nr:hypothetical protein [Verrucomicrobiae bacterium]